MLRRVAFNPGHGFIGVSRVGTDLYVCPSLGIEGGRAPQKPNHGRTQRSAPYGVLFVVERHAKSQQRSAATSALGHWKFRVGYWIFSFINLSPVTLRRSLRFEVRSEKAGGYSASLFTPPTPPPARDPWGTSHFRASARILPRSEILGYSGKFH